MGSTTGSGVVARDASARRPKILVSYRRDDSADIVGRIYDRLIARYGAGSAFLDIDSIPYAKDFREHVRDTLETSDAVLAVVGPQWRGATAERVRIMEDGDPVRVEIERALEANLPVFPLLVKRATMPTANELPNSLERFAYLNAATIDSGRDFHHHVDLLTASLDATLGLPPPPDANAPSTPATILRNPSTWAIVALLVLATAAGFAGFAPPWPPGAGPIAGVLAAIAFVALDQRLRGHGASSNSTTAASAANRSAIASAANRVVIASAVVLVLAACGYLAASSEYVFAAPNNDRFVKGFACSPDALLLYKDKCPNLGLDELRGAEYEAERLWTEQSIAIVRVALDALWCLTFVALAALAAGLRAKVQEPAHIRAKITESTGG
jgi:hypothetical protein